MSHPTETGSGERPAHEGESGLDVSLAAMSVAIRDLRGELNSLVRSLERQEAVMHEELARPASAPPEPGEVPEPPAVGWAEALIPRLFAAGVMVGSVVLLDVHFAITAVVIVVAAVVLQVRWWMAAFAAGSLAGTIALNRQVAEGAYANELGALILIFTMLALALLLSEAWGRLGSRSSASSSP
jgi:hypothetical protein